MSSHLKKRMPAGGRYLRAALSMTGVRFASMGLGFGVTALLARGLGLTEFGIFAFVVSLATLLALPMTGGLPTLLMREIAAARARQESSLQGEIIGWGYKTFAMLGFGLVALFGIAWVASRALGLWPWGAVGQLTIVPLVALTLVFGLQQVQRGVLAGHDQVVPGSLGEQLFRPFSMLILLLILGPMIWPLGSAAALWTLLAAAALAVAATFALMSRRLPRTARATPSEARRREWLLALLPLTAISATTIFKNNTDILMLGVMAPPEEVAIYRIAAQVAIFAMLAMQILRSLSAPRIASAFSLGDRVKMQRHLILVSRVMFAASALFVVVFVLVGKSVIVFAFGPDYAASFWPCLALAMGTLFSSACGLVGMVLQVTRHAKEAARAAIAAAVVNVILNLLFIPLWGALGAAIATSCATIAMQAQQWWIARRVLDLRTDVFQRNRP